jgi:hypothetical protein
LKGVINKVFIYQIYPLFYFPQGGKDEAKLLPPLGEGWERGKLIKHED